MAEEHLLVLNKINEVITLKIINIVTLSEMCEAALDGEPVFIIRAKDLLAEDTLIDYQNRAIAKGSTNRSRVSTVKEKFAKWRRENPGKMKLPD